MKIILREDVDNLGVRDEVVEVSDGYARNFLIRKGLALPAISSEVKKLNQRKKIIQQKKERVKLRTERLENSLRGIDLVIEREVGEEGKLFGAVTTQDIAEQIKKKLNILIDHRKIVLEEPIRVIGIREVSIKLHPEVEINLQVEVKKSAEDSKKK